MREFKPKFWVDRPFQKHECRNDAHYEKALYCFRLYKQCES